MSKVMIKVIEVEGTCVAKHKPGDCFIQEGEVSVGGLCGAAYHTLYPYIVAMLYDARFPYAEEGNKLQIRCPDPHNSVVLELVKLDQE